MKLKLIWEYGSGQSRSIISCTVSTDLRRITRYLLEEKGGLNKSFYITAIFNKP